MKIELTQRQADKIAEKLMDLGNLTLIALVFGQFAPGWDFSGLLASFGFTSFGVAYATAYYLMRGEDYAGAD